MSTINGPHSIDASQGPATGILFYVKHFSMFVHMSYRLELELEPYCCKCCLLLTWLVPDSP